MVCFALVNVIGMLAYAFKGIGKFMAQLLPWHFTGHTTGIFTDDNIYALILMGVTSLYAIKGGMVSIVITEVTQFAILTLTAVTIGVIAIARVTPDMIAHNIPAGWMNPFFGWTLNLNWTWHLEHRQLGAGPGRQQLLFHHHRPDVLQGRARQPGRPGAQRMTCSAFSRRAIRARPA